jgi:hypothetical protein
LSRKKPKNVSYKTAVTLKNQPGHSIQTRIGLIRKRILSSNREFIKGEVCK